MHNEIQKTTKIMDELSSLLMNSGSKEIDIKLKFNDECTTIHMTDYDTQLSNEIIDNLSQFLNIPRQTEVEEYYWGLMGETSDDDEMFLVGSMIDTAKFELIDGNLHIEIIRTHK